MAEECDAALAFICRFSTIHIRIHRVFEKQIADRLESTGQARRMIILHLGKYSSQCDYFIVANQAVKWYFPGISSNVLSVFFLRLAPLPTACTCGLTTFCKRSAAMSVAHENAYKRIEHGHSWQNHKSFRILEWCLTSALQRYGELF